MKKIMKANLLFAFMVLSIIGVQLAIIMLPIKSISLIVVLIIPEITILVVSVIYAFIAKPGMKDDMKFNLPPISEVFLLVLVGIFIVPLASLLNSISMVYSTNAVSSTLDRLYSYPIWVGILTMAVLPAVCEELAFRGYIFHGHRNKNVMLAIILNGFLFGLFHMNFNQFTYALFMGMIFAIVVEVTGSVISSMIVHFMFNTYNVVTSFAANKYLIDNPSVAEELSNTTNTLNLAFYVRLLMSAILFSLVVFFILRHLAKRHGTYERLRDMFKHPIKSIKENKDIKVIDVFLIAGCVICVVFCFV